MLFRAHRLPHLPAHSLRGFIHVPPDRIQDREDTPYISEARPLVDLHSHCRHADVRLPCTAVQEDDRHIPVPHLGHLADWHPQDLLVQQDSGGHRCHDIHRPRGVCGAVYKCAQGASTHPGLGDVRAGWACVYHWWRDIRYWVARPVSHGVRVPRGVPRADGDCKYLYDGADCWEVDE